MTTGIDFGSSTVGAIYWGDLPVESVYHGYERIWSAALCQEFTDVVSPLGILEEWIIDGIGELEAGLGSLAKFISNGVGQLIDETGTVVGYLMKFIPSPQAIESQLTGIITGQTNLGALISGVPLEAQAAICSGLNSVGGVVQSATGSPQGLLAFINGIPVLGSVATAAENLFAGIASDVSNLQKDPLTAIEESITNIFGHISVDPHLGMLIGAISDQTTNTMHDATNFVTDAQGNLVGFLTCGQYRSVSAVAGALENIVYPVGVMANQARLLVPDGLVSLPTQTSIARNVTQLASAAQGFLEVQIGAIGGGGLATQIFRAFDNTGLASSGVGIDLRDSMISLVVRANGLDTLVAPQIGAFANGDIIRLVQNAPYYTLLQNGQQIFQWVDTQAQVVLGALNNAVAMVMQAAQNLLGPRYFSPSVHYVCAA